MKIVVSPIFSGLLVVIILFSTYCQCNNNEIIDIKACLNRNWAVCGKSIGKSIYMTNEKSWKIGASNVVRILGHRCTANVKIRLNILFGAFWDGKFECPTIRQSLVGLSFGYDTPNMAIQAAIESFMVKNIQKPPFISVFT